MQGFITTVWSHLTPRASSKVSIIVPICLIRKGQLRVVQGLVLGQAEKAPPRGQSQNLKGSSQPSPMVLLAPRQGLSLGGGLSEGGVLLPGRSPDCQALGS